MKKILVIDDDHNVQSSISEILRQSEYLPISAKNGEEAIPLFTREIPDTVLLDINMPGINGMEVLKKLKDIDPDIPIIMITAYGSISTAVEALKDGAYDFITKPADINKLLITIKNACKTFDIIKQNRRLLIQQSKMAAMGEMIGAIAHQWRQPLNAVNLIAQDLSSAYEYGELNREYLGRSVGDIMKQVSFMSNTIDDFRNFFKPDKEKIPFKINTIIKEVINLLYEQIGRANIDISLSCSYEGAVKKETKGYRDKICTCMPELIALGYPNEFKQAVLNLITNSRDAIIEQKEKGLNVNGHKPFISIEISKNNDKVIVKFRDNGGGIPDKLIADIFSPYITSKKDGTGIGLYISKTIIETHMGGRLTVKNIAGGIGESPHINIGAEFTMELKAEN